MFKFALAVLLPLSIIFYGVYRPYIEGASSEPAPQQARDVLEKLAVSNAEITLDLDLDKLTSTSSGSGISKPARVRFDAAANTFFSIKVFNGEIRGALPGVLHLVPKNTADLPAKLESSRDSLLLEKVATGDHEFVIKDMRTGFTFFNVQGHSFEFDPANRSFSIRNGSLLLSQEFAADIGTDANRTVGRFSLSASAKQVEVSEISGGEVRSSTLPALGDPESGSVPGPDVVVGNLRNLGQFGSSDGTYVGLAVATDSCNFGTVDLNWLALPNNDHPVIPQNLYRMSGGPGNDERFEQIGQSNVKHAFQALEENFCNLGCNGVGGNKLGSGCSDPYEASLNAGPNLGSRAWINPFAGAFPAGGTSGQYVANNHSGHTHNGTSHRILTGNADLNTVLNSGATYYAEAQYITPHEYAHCQANPGQCNMYNNVSYRRFSVSGTTCSAGSQGCYSFTAVNPTVATQPAIHAWPGSTRVEMRPDPGNDGIAYVAFKVTQTSPGLWHYEYVVYNQNLDRAIQSFAVPLAAGAVLTNVGFHAPPQHPGWANDGTVGNAGFSNTPWAANQTASSIAWTTETFAQNQNANAIRWGTMYNFRFDSNKPPQTSSATVGFFKTGSPINVSILAPADAASDLTLSGRVFTEGALRGLGLVKVTLSDGVNPPRTAYTNSFGFYRFDNISAGTSYTITAYKLRHTFTQKQMAINGNLTGINFVAGQ